MKKNLKTPTKIKGKRTSYNGLCYFDSFTNGFRSISLCSEKQSQKQMQTACAINAAFVKTL